MEEFFLGVLEFFMRLLFSVFRVLFSSFINHLNYKVEGKRMVKHIYAKKSSFVCELIGKGANVNHPDRNGYTPLMAAIITRDTNVIQALLKRPDLDLNLKDCDGKTALFHAIQNGKIKFAKHIVQQEGLDINARDKKNHTALYYAEVIEDPELLQMINAKLEAANPNRNYTDEYSDSCRLSGF